jgi:DNA-binding FadR family transcriptional regulator
MVVASIREYIIANKLRSGDSLPTEGELAEQLGVSRVSVREATQALAFMGIIDAAPRRGLSIGQFSMDRVSKYMNFHFAVSDYPLSDLIDTRIILEVGGLKQVARKMAADPSIYDELNEINAALRTTDAVQDWIENDIRFHRRLAQATGLDAIVAFHDLLQVFFQRFRENFPEVGWEESVQSHQKIIDFLRSNNPDDAAEELTRHISAHRDRIPELESGN